MPKSIAELAKELQDDILPGAGDPLGDLPQFGAFTPPPPAGAYRFEAPADLSNQWELFEPPDKAATPHKKRVRLIFDRDHPLKIVQGKAYVGEPFETRLTNNERVRGRDKSVVASDLDYLLAALGYKEKPGGNKECMELVSKLLPRKQFGGDIRYSWRCSKDRDIRAKRPDGSIVPVEGKKGCGASYFMEDAQKDANGQVLYEQTCECGNVLRAFANLDNLRA